LPNIHLCSHILRHFIYVCDTWHISFTCNTTRRPTHCSCPVLPLWPYLETTHSRVWHVTWLVQILHDALHDSLQCVMQRVIEILGNCKISGNYTTHCMTHWNIGQLQRLFAAMATEEISHLQWVFAVAYGNRGNMTRSNITRHIAWLFAVDRYFLCCYSLTWPIHVCDMWHDSFTSNVTQYRCLMSALLTHPAMTQSHMCPVTGLVQM